MCITLLKWSKSNFVILNLFEGVEKILEVQKESPIKIYAA